MYSTTEFYGVLLQQSADAVHMLLARTSDYLRPEDLSTYRWQGLVNILVAFWGAVSLGVAVGVALRSRLAGVFAWACLMTTPLYLGMSHVDFKDIPVAAGLTAVSCGLVLSHAWVRRVPAYLGGLLFVVPGAVVTLGVRPGAWPLLVLLCAVSLALFAVSDVRRRSLTRLTPGLVACVSAGAVALALLWLTNPIARIDLVTWLVDTFRVASQYPVTGVIRTMGQDVQANDIPWWYVPAWLVAQLPLLTSIAVALGIVAAIASLAGARWSIDRDRLQAFAPLGVQGLLLPLTIVAGGAVLYDGIRHVLFMLPALCGTAAISIAVLELRAGRVDGAGRLLPVLAAVAIVAMGLFANARWFPYSYAFINPVAGWDRDSRNWELDYWGVAAAEGVVRLQEMGAGPVTALPTESTSLPFGGDSREILGDKTIDSFGLYFFARGDQALAPPGCVRVFDIKRDGHTLGEGLVCSRQNGQ